MQALSIVDVSALARYGVKGPQAEKWLVSHGVVVPAKENSWVLDDEKTLVMRLGTSEFLIEDQFGGQTCTKLVADNNRVAGVYKVPRADASFLLAGSDIHLLLSELCALDLRESTLSENALVMTQVAAISATVVRQSINNETTYRLWCDGTYGVYMLHVISEIVEELNRGK